MPLLPRIILIIVALAYLISPADLIPDLLLPWVGWIDDGLILWCIYHLARYGKLPDLPFRRPGRRAPGPGSPKPPPGSKAAPRSKESEPSPFTVLGVNPDASWEEIQKTYKEKIKQYHPDKLSHLGEEFSSLANEKFLAIQRAYQTLEARYKKK